MIVLEEVIKKAEEAETVEMKTSALLMLEKYRLALIEAYRDFMRV